MTNFRNFTNGITFYVSDWMRRQLDEMSKERRVPVSVVLREIVSSHFGVKNISQTNHANSSIRETERKNVNF